MVAMIPSSVRGGEFSHYAVLCRLKEIGQMGHMAGPSAAHLGLP